MLFRVDVENAHRLDSLKQFVLVANHNSHLDTLLLYLAVPTTQLAFVRPVAKRAYFSTNRFLFAAVNFAFRPIWVDRGDGGSAVDRMVQAIDRGDSLIVFPEGTRGEPGQLGTFKWGVGSLGCRRPEIAVVPVFLAGTERSLPRNATIPRFVRHRVIVGPPHELEGAPRDIACSLRHAVAELGRTPRFGSVRLAPPRPRPLLVAVIGIDGCGKSTVSRDLARELSLTSRTCLIGDSLEFYQCGRRAFRSRPALESIRQWLARRAKRARSLASYKIPKLLELLTRDALAWHVARSGEVDMIVMDGSPLLNLLAWGIIYRERAFDEGVCTQALAILTSSPRNKRSDAKVLDRLPELALLTRLHLNHLQLPHAAIFLDLAPDLAMHRITARGERRQIHESVTHLDKLRSAYRTVSGILERHPRTAAFRLDATSSIDVLVAEAARTTKRIGSQCHA